jgi:hypothetical protein
MKMVDEDTCQIYIDQIPECGACEALFIIMEREKERERKRERNEHAGAQEHLGNASNQLSLGTAG